MLSKKTSFTLSPQILSKLRSLKHELLDKLRDSVNTFELIDHYYDERIQLNAIKSNNAYNFRHFKKHWAEIHEKLTFLEQVGTLKKNNYFRNPRKSVGETVPDTKYDRDDQGT